MVRVRQTSGIGNGQQDMFTSPQARVLVERIGRDAAIEAAQGGRLGHIVPNDAERLLRSRRGKKAVALAADFMSEASFSDPCPGYTFSGWCLAGFPHKRKDADTNFWRLDTGYVKLLVEAGH
jgi:hypothetical protein